MVNISGGKDSACTLVKAVNAGVSNILGVFADTGNEHDETYRYVEWLSGWLESKTGKGIQTVRADFSREVENKRDYVLVHWPEDLTKDTPGKWVPLFGRREYDEPPAPPAEPKDPFKPARPTKDYSWRPARRGLSPAEARAFADEAASILVPSGNPYLDLCLWKGRFPSSQGQFCTQSLKVTPINEQVIEPLLGRFKTIYSWQGVRRDESRNRSKLDPLELEFGDPDKGTGLWIYRPILDLTAEDVFDVLRANGVRWNPLYEQGMERVGCMPCIHAKKSEIREIAKRFPQEIERIARWETLVSKAARRGCSTFFPVKNVPNDEISLESHGVHRRVEWSLTTRGGRNVDMLLKADFESDEPLACNSVYGLCE